MRHLKDRKQATRQSVDRSIDQPKNARRAFTIVELLMVIGIISVLITITVSAVSGSIERARGRKAEAICTLVEQGIATYYAQKGKWPVNGLEDKTPNADASGNANAENKTVYLLDEGGARTDGEVQKMVKAVVEETANGHPMMDVSGLFVARKNSHKYGMDFFSAIRGTKKNKEGIPLSDMVFGYPDASTGEFRMFKMTYSPDADKVTVSKQ